MERTSKNEETDLLIQSIFNQYFMPIYPDRDT